jgi:hypothetical protein
MAMCRIYIWQAYGDTELSNVFQICSSNALGLATSPVNPTSFGLSDIAGHTKRIHGHL